MTVLVKERIVETQNMRDLYCPTLMTLMEEDARVSVLDADLVYAMGLRPLLQKYPQRAFDCGIMEAGMLSFAAGLSLRGLVPYAHGFGAFITRRALDHLYISLCYAGLNAKLIATDPGITGMFNGGTHMSLEDMGTLRAIPGITLLDPSDNVMFKALLRSVKDVYGVHYIRMNRKRVLRIYEEGSHFTIGKGIVVEEGNDATIIASGLMLEQALLAAQCLRAEGIRTRVVDMFTWKPLDEELVLRCADETGAIVVAENHSIVTGLGSAVASVLSQHKPVPLGLVGIEDRFGEVGDLEYLMRVMHMDSATIAQRVKETIRKNKERRNGGDAL